MVVEAANGFLPGLAVEEISSLKHCQVIFFTKNNQVLLFWTLVGLV
jgi:hypothetical protein